MKQEAIETLKQHPISNSIISFAMGLIIALSGLGIVPEPVGNAAREAQQDLIQQRTEAYQDAKSHIAKMIDLAETEGTLHDDTLRQSLTTQHFVLGLADSADRTAVLLGDAMDDVLTPEQQQAVQERYFQLLSP